MKHLGNYFSFTSLAKRISAFQLLALKVGKKGKRRWSISLKTVGLNLKAL